jgi:hypothetical protein
MQKGKLYSKVGFLISMSITLVLFWFVFGSISKTNEFVPHKDDGGADLICIDTLNDLGGLERSPVMFFHSRHTETLLKFGCDCTTCHIMNEGNLSPKFKRLVDSDRETVMQAYHVNCIECHRNKSIAGEKPKPITCGGCHNFTHQKHSLFWESVEFDKHLHYTHVLSSNEECGTCHHEYDEASEKLVYKQGNESSCGYCHGENTIDKVSSLKEASHQSCIGCHREKRSKNIKGGPVDCVSCHSSSANLAIKNRKYEDIPRIKRGQPDLILIKNEFEGVNTLTQYECMGSVPFNHELHEKNNDTCLVCHHASLEQCSKCHTKSGSIDGKYINIASAMHDKDAKSSCVGCHRSKQEETRCAGCHSSIKGKNKFDEQACNSCHFLDPALKLNNQANESKHHISIEKMVHNRISKARLYSTEDIPENINIGALENEYQPVNFPHRKVVLSLFDQIEDSKLATYFHSDKGTLCLGCHHNSPLSEKPPACINCHGYNSNVSMPFKPRLVGAYHQKCMQCHDSMNLEKLNSRDCNVCHANKNAK